MLSTVLDMQYPTMHAKPFRLRYFALSFLSLLVLRYASSAYFAPPAQEAAHHDVCVSVDQPNPLALQYPNNATGTLNGTVAVIPIPLALARQLIPPQYGILEHAYRALLPAFPRDMYPVMVQALHDHDVQAFGYQIDDFTRTGIEFPFVDLLHDNTTSFKWAPSLLLTAKHDIALRGAADYGTHVLAAAFDPPCDAYAPVPHAPTPRTTSFHAHSLDSPAFLSARFAPAAATPHPRFPTAFFHNATNQPTFADGSSCSNMLRFFGTPLSSAPHNRIEPVIGTITTNLYPLPAAREFRDVYALRLASAFVENNYVPCESLRGYRGAGLE